MNNKKTKRKEAEKILGKYKGNGKEMSLTSKKFDCVNHECGECVCCRYLNFLELAYNIACPDATIIYSDFMDKYLKLVYDK
jgi:hypothetical protein